MKRSPLRIPAGYTMREIVTHTIHATLRRTGSVRAAARELGLATKTIYNHLNRPRSGDRA